MTLRTDLSASTSVTAKLAQSRLFNFLSLG